MHGNVSLAISSLWHCRKLILNDQYNKNDIKKLYIHVMTIFALKILVFDRMASDDAKSFSNKIL
jgi:hypothetical protein